MIHATSRRCLLLLLAACFALTMATAGAAESKPKKEKASPPKVGQKAKQFKLKDVNGKPVNLEKLAEKGPVVIAVLRGYPGYQCPLCMRQTAQYMEHAEAFAERDASVVLIYPGEGKDLDKRAKEFLKNSKLPTPLMLALDPDYKFTTAYGLRWDAPNETALPSTFVLDADRKVKFAKVVKEHGGRVDVKDVLKALDKK